MMTPAFDLLTARSEDQVVVKVIGELDIETAPRLRAALADLADHGSVDVTLDLSGMTFIASTGLSVFISGLKRLRETGGNLALQSPSASAMKVLEITGLTGVISIIGGVTSAADSRDDPVRVLTA